MTTTAHTCTPTPSRISIPQARPLRTWAAAAAVIVATVAGCASGGEVSSPIASPPSAPTTSGAAPGGDGEPAGHGIVAKPASTAFPMEARDIRLVRLGEGDIALQFELYNGTEAPVEPYDLGLGLIERNFKLVDLPRGTAYDVQQADGFDGRVSANQYEEIAPGSTATITAVFTAPPEETMSMWFMTNVLLPVEVPIEPAGSGRTSGSTRASPRLLRAPWTFWISSGRSVTVTLLLLTCAETMSAVSAINVSVIS